MSITGATWNVDTHLLKGRIIQKREREEEREREGAMLKIEAKLEGIQEAKKMFSSDLIKKATRSAIDRSATYGKKCIAESVPEHYHIKARDVKTAIQVKRTTQKLNEADIVTKGKPLGFVDYFHATQDRGGVSVSVAKDHTTRFPHAFMNIARNSGKRVIMKRIGRARYPTTGKKMIGASIPRLVGSSKIWESAKEKIMGFLNQEFKDQLEKRLRIKGR
jgi:hypothetical protein